MPIALPDNFQIDYDALAANLEAAGAAPELYQVITDTPFLLNVEMALLHLGITVLLLTDQVGQTLNRIALSDTKMAQATTQVSMKPFHQIKIPLNQLGNILVEAITTGQPVATDDWDKLFRPELTAQQARLNQANAGIGCSVAQPLPGKQGVMIFSYFQEKSALIDQHYDFMARYASLASAALAR